MSLLHLAQAACAVDKAPSMYTHSTLGVNRPLWFFDGCGSVNDRKHLVEELTKNVLHSTTRTTSRKRAGV